MAQLPSSGNNSVEARQMEQIYQMLSTLPREHRLPFLESLFRWESGPHLQVLHREIRVGNTTPDAVFRQVDEKHPSNHHSNQVIEHLNERNQNASRKRPHDSSETLPLFSTPTMTTTMTARHEANPTPPATPSECSICGHDYAPLPDNPHSEKKRSFDLTEHCRNMQTADRIVTRSDFKQCVKDCKFGEIYKDNLQEFIPMLCKALNKKQITCPKKYRQVAARLVRDHASFHARFQEKLKNPEETRAASVARILGISITTKDERPGETAAETQARIIRNLSFTDSKTQHDLKTQQSINDIILHILALPDPKSLDAEVLFGAQSLEISNKRPRTDSPTSNVQQQAVEPLPSGDPMNVSPDQTGSMTTTKHAYHDGVGKANAQLQSAVETDGNRLYPAGNTDNNLLGAQLSDSGGFHEHQNPNLAGTSNTNDSRDAQNFNQATSTEPDMNLTLEDWQLWLRDFGAINNDNAGEASLPLSATGSRPAGEDVNMN